MSKTSAARRDVSASSVAARGDAAVRGQTDNTAIRPFPFHAPEEELTELRRRINATSGPSGKRSPMHSQGVQLATIQKLARYWATDTIGARSRRN